MVTADADLTLAAQRAGVDLSVDPVMVYLKAIKVQTSSTIAVYFKDVNAVQTTIQKLAAGITVRGTECKLGTEDPGAIAASWIVLYEIVKMKYQASITAAAPIPTPTPTPTTAASSATDKDTIPKTLSAGVLEWRETRVPRESPPWRRQGLGTRAPRTHRLKALYGGDARRDHVPTSLHRPGHRERGAQEG